jgi:hypothetical protein
MHTRSMSFSWRATACLALTAATAAASATSAPVVVAAPAAAIAEAPRVEWNLRNAEHLLNRAAFGATSDEAQAAVARGMQATIEALCRSPRSSAGATCRSTSSGQRRVCATSKGVARACRACSPTSSPR